MKPSNAEGQPLHPTVRDCIVCMISHVRTLDGQLGVNIATGFVVVVNGQWLWITAGHVIDDANRMAEQHKVEAVRLMPLQTTDFVDFSYRVAEGASLKTIISQTPDIEEELKVLSEMDAGFVVLRDIYINQLKTLGVKPLTNEEYFDPPQQEWDNLLNPPEGQKVACYVIGVPADSIQHLANSKYAFLHIKGPVWPTEMTALEVTLVPGKQWHYEGDAIGMSGGPIFLEIGEKAFLLGIQSSRMGVEGKKPRWLTAVQAPRFMRILTILLSEMNLASAAQ